MTPTEYREAQKLAAALKLDGALRKGELEAELLQYGGDWDELFGEEKRLVVTRAMR